MDIDEKFKSLREEDIKRRRKDIEEQIRRQQEREHNECKLLVKKVENIIEYPMFQKDTLNYTYSANCEEMRNLITKINSSKRVTINDPDQNHTSIEAIHVFFNHGKVNIYLDPYLPSY